MSSAVEQVSPTPTLLSVLDHVVDEIEREFFGTSEALLLYGSFSYRNLADPLESREKAVQLLDKKPDFLVLVKDLEDALIHVGERYSWKPGTVGRVLRFTRDTPFYFNSHTLHPYVLDGEQVPVPYKIGLMEADDFVKLSQKALSTFFVAGRVSKPVNSVGNHHSTRINSTLDLLRDIAMDVTVQTLPEAFTGKLFMEQYLALSYWSEMYRFFDLGVSALTRGIPKKAEEIFQKDFFDCSTGELQPMRQVLYEMLAPRLAVHPDVESVSPSLSYEGFSSHIFSHPQPNCRDYRELFVRFMKYNATSFSVSVQKNRVTNALGNGNNWEYMGRKATQFLS